MLAYNKDFRMTFLLKKYYEQAREKVQLGQNNFKCTFYKDK